MSWRSIIISQPARISLGKQQLLIEQQQTITVPLEDIAVIVIEAREVVLTTPLLSALAEYGITLFTCNDSHLPNGQWLSLLPHSRQTKIVRQQVAMSEPLKKRLWQRIVSCKISNQAQHLIYLKEHEAADYLTRLIVQLRSEKGNYSLSTGIPFIFFIVQLRSEKGNYTSQYVLNVL